MSSFFNFQMAWCASLHALWDGLRYSLSLRRGLFPAALTFGMVVLVALPLRAAVTDSESALLVDDRAVGDLQRVKVSLKAQGTLQTEQKSASGEDMVASVAANGWLEYQERVLALHPVVDDVPRVSISGRYYDAAQAKVKIDNHEETIELGESERIVLARSTHATDFMSAQTPLTQSQVEMIMVPGNSLAVYALLPGRSVSVGQTWEHAPEDMVSLLNLDEITVCHARSRLLGIENGLAKVGFVAHVIGNVEGAASELKVEGDYRFDTRWKRVSWLSLIIEEDRQASAAAPGFVMRAELKLLASPLNESSSLSAKAIQQLAAVYKHDGALLRYDAPRAGYHLLHGPQWKLINDRPEMTSFRMVDENTTIAQCNIQRLKKQEPGKRLGLETFQSDIEKALGSRFGRFSQAREFDRKDGYHVLQVAAIGVVKEIPVQWVYYHLTSPQGECASYAYTMELDAAEKFAGHDAAMINSMQLAALPQPSANPADANPGPVADPSRSAARVAPGQTGPTR